MYICMSYVYACMDTHVTWGGLSDNEVFCLISGHLSSNDRDNYQLKFPLSLFGNSDLQKMIIQFCTLNSKVKHLVSYNTSIQ